MGRQTLQPPTDKMEYPAGVSQKLPITNEILHGQEVAMAQARVHISLFNLIIEVESDFQYPDMMQDLANRALTSFITTMDYCKANGMDIRSEEFDLEDTDED